MDIKKILFPEANRAALVDANPEPKGDDYVIVKTAISTISAGTERANITGDANVAGRKAPSVKFPRGAGYSSAGTVVEVGPAVTRVKPGDRVAVVWGSHSSYNVVSEKNVVKIEDDNITFAQAALLLISTFSMAAIRKCRFEVGEAAMVMGLGILGQFAIRILHAAGAAPLIAVDPVAKRRGEALNGGADYALDPFEEGFADKVKALTGGKGVPVCIEVTGQGAGFDQALDCMAQFGRIALLGCTRNKDFSIDYYRKIHCPGITVIGAHTQARPKVESAPGWFTEVDDMEALMRLMACGRLKLDNMESEMHSPEECPEVYQRLIHDREFPPIVQFDWSRLEG